MAVATIYLTTDEKERLKKAAAHAGLSLSAWMRKVLLPLALEKR